MAPSYDVHIWSISERRRKTKTTWYVRWKVANEKFNEPFATDKLAISFHAELLTAANNGKPFDTVTGLPPSLTPPSEVTWYQAACRYVDGRWKSDPAHTRQVVSKGLVVIGEALLPLGRGRPDGALLRYALRQWAFRWEHGAPLRSKQDAPPEVKAVLRWVERHSPPISVLNDGGAQRVLDHLPVRVDGKPGILAPNTIRWRHIQFVTFVHWCLKPKQGLLRDDPLKGLEWDAPDHEVQPVDPRLVPNPMQVRTLLFAIRDYSPTGRRVFAYLACIWLTGMRPEEAAGMRHNDLDLPAAGWGTIYLARPTPWVGAAWTDSGEGRDDRDRLKHRKRGVVRPVGCPPELTAILNGYIGECGPGPGGLVFFGPTGGALSYAYSVDLWRLARAAVFTEEVAATDLARRQYDLRHSWASLMFAANEPPAEIAEALGHSLEMLLQVYARMVHRGRDERQRRQEAAFGYRPPRTPDAHNQRRTAAVGGGQGWSPIRLTHWRPGLSLQVKLPKLFKGRK